MGDISALASIFGYALLPFIISVIYGCTKCGDKKIFWMSDLLALGLGIAAYFVVQILVSNAFIANFGSVGLAEGSVQTILPMPVEGGLKLTTSLYYSPSGKTIQAERCLNNASEHFIKLGNEVAEAAALRLLADIYDKKADLQSATRCLERVVDIGRRYRLPDATSDSQQLAQLRARQHPT